MGLASNQCAGLSEMLTRRNFAKPRHLSPTDPPASSSIESVHMGTALIREDWEGRIVDGKYALLEWLGGSGESGVFLTVLDGVQRGAIKLIPAQGAEADAYLAEWEKAKALSDIHLMQVLATGHCAMDGTDVVYVVTEHAEKVLSKFLPEKPLRAHEAKNIFDPVLHALSYLHENGFVHGHIKPSNILVSGGELKISSDDFFVADGVPKPPRKAGMYDAPEVAGGMLTAAADVWSVGMSMIEALTQRPPARDSAAGEAPIVPETLPLPFLEIVQDCLRPNPAQRCTIGDIQARLEARIEARPEVRTETGAGSQPDGQLGRRTFATAGQERAAASERAAPVAQPASRWKTDEAVPLPTLFKDIEEANLTRFSVTPILIGAVVVLAVAAFLVMRSNGGKIPWPPFQTHSAPAVSQQPAQPQTPAGAGQSADSTSPSAPSASGSETPAAAPAPTETQSTPATGGTSAQPQSPPASAGETPTAPAAGAAAAQAQTPAASPAKTQSPVATSPAASQSPVAPSVASEATTRGAVASRVLPNVSSSAFESMHGPVEVETRVYVDRSGSVSNAAYITQGPGNYFARISLRAAQAWKFTPPQTHGHAESSVWLLRFHFSHGKTEVTATEEGRE
jgi:serine/threonine protein kinase